MDLKELREQIKLHNWELLICHNIVKMKVVTMIWARKTDEKTKYTKPELCLPLVFKLAYSSTL
jgi:hypothetical protein